MEVTYIPERIEEIPLRLESGEAVCDVIDMTVDGEGNFYLADRKCHGVWIVDKRGKQLHRIGGWEGRGPGELSKPISVALSGDTLAILESGNYRVSFFSRRGRFLFSFPLQGGGAPSGLEFGSNNMLIVSEWLGIRNFDIYTLSGHLVHSDSPQHIPPVFAPVLLAGGHMSLMDDGFILFSYIRSYSVVKLDWKGAKHTEFRASPPGYHAPNLQSIQAAAVQKNWSVVGLPLQVGPLILIQWFNRRMQEDDSRTAVIERFADLFTLDGRPLQLAVPLPTPFLFAQNEFLYGVAFERLETEAVNPLIVVYRLKRSL